MRRPHVYERTAPRGRPEPLPPIPPAVEVAGRIRRTLPAMIAAARAEGLDGLADALEIARKQAEIATERGKVMVVEE